MSCREKGKYWDKRRGGGGGGEVKNSGVNNCVVKTCDIVAEIN